MLKKFTFCVLVSALGLGQLTAGENGKLRTQYLNFSYVSQTIDFPALVSIPQSYVGDNYDILSGVSYKSEIGAALTFGATFFLHKKPLADMVRIGLDVTFLDLNGAKYEADGIEADGFPVKTDMYQAEIGMGIGPSVTVNPYKKLNFHVYGRYAPSYSALYRDETLSGKYVGFFVTGGAVYWGMIGVGAEARFGRSTYKDIGSSIFDGYDDVPEALISEYKSRKLKTSGVRAYLTLRF